MADRLRMVRERIRALFGRAATEAPPDPGESTLMTADAAMRLVETRLCDRLAETAAAAGGMTLGGLRSTAFVDGSSVEQARAALAAAARRRAPLVVHLAPRGPNAEHAAYHALAGCGAFLTFAGDPQQAVDLTVAARTVAELSLTPGVVAVDGRETAAAIRDVRLPSEDLLAELVGRPTDELECPTAAQRLVFGERRRRVARWFDADRPVAVGSLVDGPERAAAQLGRDRFFEAHVLPIAEEVLAALSRRTGRSLGLFREHALRDARQVLVVQGAVVETAVAVADHLRRTEGQKIGVLGLGWLRPFPADALREALGGAEAIAVLERVGPSFRGDPPLLTELRVALPAGDARIYSVSYGQGGGQPEAERLAELCRYLRQANGTRVFHLGVEPPTVGSSFPRREALLQRVHRDYADLELCAVPRGKPLDLLPEGSLSIALHGRVSGMTEALLLESANVLREQLTHVLARWRRSPSGLRSAQVIAAPRPVGETGAGAPLDLALVLDGQMRADFDPVAGLRRQGALVIESDREPAGLWLALPAAWRSRIREREVRLWTVAASGVEAVRRAVELLGSGAAAASRAIDWRDLAEPPMPADGRQLPAVVRRFARPGSSYDNVSRFWGESAQPHSEGEAAAVAEPYLALAAVPASTAAFARAMPARATLPVIEPDRCTGCGRCWTACPDAAIATVVSGTEAWLDACAERAVAEAPLDRGACQKLGRAHRPWAALVDAELARQAAPVADPAALRVGFERTVEKMKSAGEERAALAEVFAAIETAGSRLPMLATRLLFHEPHAAQKGRGLLLGIAIDPRACQACGICASVCPEEAVRLEPRTPAVVERARGEMAAWEHLPDTPGEAVARMAGRPEIGGLAAALTSRHCAYAVVGGPGSEPGSGARLAVRQLLAIAEHGRQREALERLRELSDLEERLREAVSTELTGAAKVADLDRLEHALKDARATAPMAEVLERLDRTGDGHDVDLDRLRSLVESVRAVERLRWDLESGPEGQGRARFGLVVSGRAVIDWAGRFPHNPFGAPLVVDLDGEGPELAIGLITAQLERALEETRAVRRARLRLEAPPELASREREIDGLGWSDLDAGERRAAPPLIVLADAAALGAGPLGGLSRLLRSGLPVKVVVLDDRDLLAARADATLLALAHREAYVLASSPAFADHLYEGAAAAFDFPGPALVHLHAPSPAEEGCEPAETLARAREAVLSRVHPLLSYDPAEPGAFGLRLDLSGNPSPEQGWPESDPVSWAFGAGRYREAFADEAPGRTAPFREWCSLSTGERAAVLPVFTDPGGRRLAVGGNLAGAAREAGERWRTLQELAGLVTPFTERLRQRLADEIEKTHRLEVEALERRHIEEIAELRKNQKSEHAARLRDRLLQLAGYRPPRREG